jgi:hypothetical protein
MATLTTFDDEKQESKATYAYGADSDDDQTSFTALIAEGEKPTSLV